MADVLTPKRQATALEAEAIAEVRALAREFVGTDAQLRAVLATTTGRQRLLAVRFTPHDHEDFPHLLRLLDALIARDAEVIQTRQGCVLRSDLRETEAVVEREGGRELLRFPVRYPRTGGVRAAAVFRPRGTGPDRGSFRVGPAAPKREREWWEGEG